MKLTEIKQQKYLLFPIAFIAILIDQITKYIVRINISEGESISLFTNVFHLTHTQNTGAAFSLFSESTHILSIISFVAAILIIGYFILTKNKFSTLEITAWGMLLGGTIGNLLDRTLIGSVTDFFDFTLINFPVFNFADIFIDTGAFLILFVFIFLKKDDK